MITEIDERRIDAIDLKVGMFVCRLDRPWEGTPFPLQGVELRSEADIKAIRDLCHYVYIDALRQAVDTSRAVLARESVAETRFRSSVTYVDRATVDEEMPHAVEALANATAMVDRVSHHGVEN